MKRGIIALMGATLLLSGCDTYAGAEAYSGSMLGSILGSAIGGIAGGPRGADIGTIVGMAGGAVVGGAIGNAKDEQVQQERDAYEQRRADRAASRQRQRQQQSATANDGYDSGFDPSNSGDDRLYDFGSSDYTGDYSARQPQTTMPMESSVAPMTSGMTYIPALEVRNARFVDANQNGQIERGEVCKIIFEVYNRGKQTLYDVQPTVIEATGNKHVFISPNIHVEQIQPGKGIRYTALIKADNRLKNGTAKFAVSVLQGSRAISEVSEFNIPTRK